MELKLIRKYKKQHYCIGELYIDGKFFCNTIEDKDRGISQNMSVQDILNKKIYGKTAIPTGTYHVVLNVISLKFKNRAWAKPMQGKLPRLLNVKGFDGVLIHVGNSAEDSLGCIIVGENKIKGKVINSTKTFNALYDILQKSKTDIILTIV